jgi:hypothetical protein
MKKALLILALTLTACTTAPAPVAPSTPAETTTTPAAFIYQYFPYGISFEIPEGWGFAKADAPYNEFADSTKGEDSFVRLQLPKETYPGTNFGNADLGLSAVYVASLEECLAYPGSDSQSVFDIKQSTVLSGITYYTSTSTGAAAGNIYDSKNYRTYQNQFCFSAAETLHTSNIGNYDPGTVTAVDEDAVWARLDAILQTVKFQ